jgi:DNA-binding NarL/FixJ family response regulator
MNPVREVVVARRNSASRSVARRDRDGRSPGVVRLSNREREIVSALVQGQSNREIAESLGVSEQTVKNQLHTLFAKCGVKGRLQLAIHAIRHGLLDKGD